MTHKHPSEDHPLASYCQRIKNGIWVCWFGYPHPPQLVTTIDNEGQIHYRRWNKGDQWVVAYCLPLLHAFKCHMNMEAANTSHLFQYLFKYIHKGPFFFSFTFFIWLINLL